MVTTVRMRNAARSSRLVAWSTAFAVALIALLGVLDHRRAAKASVEDFAREQIVVAEAIAAGLSGVSAGAAAPLPPTLDVHALEQNGDLVVLMASASSPVLRTTTGKECHVEALDQAIARGFATAELSREEAASLGMPPRRAEAGFARATTAAGPLLIAVVASALRVRDRDSRAQWRLVIEFLLTTSCALAFGAYALRAQKERLALSRELAVNEAVRALDERLVRADKLAALGAMATGIAHEVSTPLGVIVGRAEQLAPRVKDDERARRAVDAIAEQAARIGAIVRAFLAFARGDAVSLQHLPALTVVNVAMDLVRHRFEAANVANELLPDPDTIDDTVCIACDAALFPQVLVNLLLNACDACAPGERVQVRVRVVSERVRFSIVDEGEGITAENAARATEPFFTTKPAGRGTGIGLSIAKELVLHHGGSLSVVPRRDGIRGTEATVEVPMVRSGAP
jgi:signal transduction histidine kinase